jgi:hypothetical protein
LHLPRIRMESSERCYKYGVHGRPNYCPSNSNHDL